MPRPDDEQQKYNQPSPTTPSTKAEQETSDESSPPVAEQNPGT